MNAPTSTETLAAVNLDDKYAKFDGVALLSGMQALVRVPLHVHERGVRNGHGLGGYVSGYRGSPVGTYDVALWGASRFLEPRDIHFQPGVNEDLAATAVWGSQQVHLLGESRFDGIFGLWYGKSPGVDRSLDALRHANYAGTHPLGGVVAIAGDDPNAVSSTVTGCSDYGFMSVGMPLLYPANVQELLDFGVLGIELSRHSGCWVALKAVTDIAESSAIIDLDPLRLPLDWPQLASDGAVSIRWPDNRVEQEKRLYTLKLPRAIEFARAASINRLHVDGAQARIGILSAGKPWSDLMQCFQDLDLDEARLAHLGVRVLKLGMIYPLDPDRIRSFGSGLETILVVEEKRGFIEDQLKSILFAQPAAPRIIGKRLADGSELIPEYGECSPALLAEALERALPALTGHEGARAHLARLRSRRTAQAPRTALATRTPFFCSGCPHNSSTRVPDGSLALAGIGCHWLSLFMDRDNRTFTQMGGEGCTWLGAMHFSERTHVFANLGDGTYHHSGVLAIRAAVYARANITFKLLFNDAVAMTGGQQIADTFTPQQIVTQLLAEGVSKVVVVTDQPDKYQALGLRNGGFPDGVTIHHRDQLDWLQRQLREQPGVTALLYDQTCAAEKRRRRKRGTLADPDVRAYINEAVCEGCGDCSVQSNCIAVEPNETATGRKRRINQSACNKDLKCVDGFCPSFVTIEGARPRKAASHARSVDPTPSLPAPARAPLAPVHETVITGIGGTGVITIGAIIAMAARLEGLSATCLDQTGIAQKNGAVLSHVRIAAQPDDLHAPRIATSNADLMLGCDMMVAASPAALATLRHGDTRVALNTHLAPHAAFVLDPVQADFGEPLLKQSIEDAVGAAQVACLGANHLATTQFGDAIATNMIMLGFALQKGWLPVSLAAVQRAIELNAVAVAANLAALECGRRAALSDGAQPLAAPSAQPIVFERRRPLPALEEWVAQRSADLVAYQSRAYAKRYTTLLTQVREAEQRLTPGRDALSRAVALQAYRLLAYKDEYEIARLYTDGRFMQALRADFEGELRIHLHLAPPLLSKVGLNGRPGKRRFGAWMLGAMRLLARLKILRGTPFDPFGHTEERRLERELIEVYWHSVTALLPQLSPDNHAHFCELVRMPERIRGFGPVKMRTLLETVDRWREHAIGTACAPFIERFAGRVQPHRAAASLQADAPLPSSGTIKST